MLPTLRATALALLAAATGCAPTSGDANGGRPDAAAIPGRPDGGFRPEPTGDGGPLDGGVPDVPDRPDDPDGPRPLPDAAPPDETPYRHTVSIDGIDDFAVGDSFPTTTVGFAAYVTYDDDFVYVGYRGPDIGGGSETLWVQFFFDVGSGAGSGAGSTTGETYNTQQPGMPSGLSADYYFRWRATGDFFDLRQFTAGAWTATAATPTAALGTGFFEAAIALADLGRPTSLGVTALIVKETPFAEACFAGLYADNFIDDYYPVATSPVPMTRYVQLDFTSPAPPNDADNRRP